MTITVFDPLTGKLVTITFPQDGPPLTQGSPVAAFPASGARNSRRALATVWGVVQEASCRMPYASRAAQTRQTGPSGPASEMAALRNRDPAWDDCCSDRQAGRLEQPHTRR